MADKQTSVALNIGSQRVSMAVFDTSKSGGLVLKAYDSETIIADPALDAARATQIRIAIADLARRLNVGHAKVRYAVSGQAVFTRFVKLPPIQQDNVEQLVTFEAQQHVPFPLDDVVWDYELIQGASEQEAVIVAIKGDALDEINAAVQDASMETSEVDVAPMALYNAYRVSYGVPDEPVLLIDIGAKTSNLIYLEGQRFFTRSIPIGGVAVTAAIAKEYGVSFGEAEKQKVVNGLCALGGGHTEQLDESVAALAIVIRNALGRLPAEIARTTNYYRSQHGGSAPRKVLLAGGGANLPYTLEFFHEKLNLPIEFFNPVRKLALAKGVDPAVIQRDGHTMGELVGLGLRGIGKSQIHIDLVPSVVEQARADQKRRPLLIAAAVAVVAGVGAWAACQMMAAGKAEEMAQVVKEQRDNLEPYKTGIEGLLKKEEKLKQLANAYADVESDHVLWFDLLAELRGAFASDAVWLTSFEPLTGFDPSLVVAPDYDPKKGDNGQLVVEDSFERVKYGDTSMARLQDKRMPEASNKKKKAAPAGPMVDAVRIRGYWRENPRGSNLVSDLLKRLQEKSDSFQFEIENPVRKKPPINLAADEYIGKILTVAAVPVESGDLAQPFEITLPLARKAEIK